MFAKLLSATILALAVNSAAGQINPAAGVVLNGASNIASGDYSGVGGSGSESRGVGGLVWGIGSRQLGGGSAFGRNLRADGTDTHVSGQGVWALRDNGGGNGWANISSGMQGWVTGHQSNDRGIQGARAYAIGSFVHTGDEGRGVGDAQRIELILRTITTDAMPKQLSSSAYNVPAGISPNVNVLTVPDNATLRVKGAVVARQASTGLSRSWEFKALIGRDNGALTTALVGSTVAPEFADAGTGAWGFTVIADTGKGSLGLVSTGEAGKTIQWVAHILSVENVGGADAPPPPPPPPTLTVTTTSLPAGSVGAPYSAALAASGGVAPYTWTASGLPAGLALSGGAIAGTPTAAFSGTVIVTAHDATNATASASLTLTIAPGESPEGTIITPGNGSITDAQGSVWTIGRARDLRRNGSASLANGIWTDSTRYRAHRVETLYNGSWYYWTYGGTHASGGFWTRI